MQPILEVKNLTKRFGSFTAVDDISFSVKEGEIVGLLGPNGAGKTTTISMLLDLLSPDSGSITYFGHQFPKDREFCLSRINYASAYSKLQGKLTVEENLKVYAGFFGMSQIEKRIHELLELLEIENTAKTLFWRLSAGQKTRVVLVKALLNHPKLILMDEPTASLDPDIAAKIIDFIETLRKKEQISVLFTSHDMADVEELCDRVIFLDHGKIVAEDSVLGLTKHIKDSILRLTFDNQSDKVRDYLVAKGFKHTFPRTHTVEIKLPERDIPKALFGLSNEGVWLTDIDIEKPDLEDVFFSIVKGSYESRQS